MQKTFTGVYVNINQLGMQVLTWLESKGYKTQILNAGNYVVIQAKKEGFLRAIFGANRAFTVRLSGGQGVLNVDVGMSDWIKAEDATEDMIAAMVFTPLALIEGIEEVYNVKIEEDIIKEIERLVSMSNNSMYQQYHQYQQPFPMYQQPIYFPQQQKVCRSCGFANPPNARFCTNCGSPLF